MPPKTAKSRRNVAIPPRLGQILRHHMRTFSNVFDPEAYVFTGPEGGQIRQSAFRKTFKAAQRKAKIKNPTARVHSLRHTAASLMAANGFSLLDAGRQLGHTAQAMTDRYSHLFPEHAAEKAAALDALFGGSR